MTGSRSGHARPAAARQVTIQDVAQAARVSRQTVSNVLNGSGRVGEAAKIRVRDAVAALGYQPNHGARSLRSRRTRQIAYVMPRVQLLPDNYIMQQFLQALAAASARQSYSMVIAVSDGDPREEIQRLVASRSVDAFLLSELQPSDPRVVMLAEAGMPFACFGRTGPSLPQHWVDIDNREATSAAVEHVLSRGFDRVAFLGYRSGNHWDAERVAGFQAGLSRSGMANEDADVLLVNDAGARRKVRSLLTPAHPAARPRIKIAAQVQNGNASKMGAFREDRRCRGANPRPRAPGPEPQAAPPQGHPRSGGSRSPMWPPMPASASARCHGWSTGASRCGPPPFVRCWIPSTGWDTGPVTRRRPWSAARRGPSRLWSLT